MVSTFQSQLNGIYIPKHLPAPRGAKLTMNPLRRAEHPGMVHILAK